MTTRRIKPGTPADFERTWRPERHPEGMLHAYAYWSYDEQEIIAVSSWVSREACDTRHASWEETHRRAAIAPYVLSEQGVLPRPRTDRPGAAVISQAGFTAIDDPSARLRAEPAVTRG